METRHLLLAANHQPQRGGDVFGLNAEFGRAVAIDVDQHLRLVEAQRDVGIEQPEFGRALPQGIRVTPQFQQVGPEQHEINVVVRSAQIDGLGIAHRAAHLGVLFELPPHFLDDVALCKIALEGLPGLGLEQPPPGKGPFPVRNQAARKTGTVDASQRAAAPD